MKVKEIDRTANIAWSPQEQYPVYMVTGTAAQQLDATFSTSAALELYSLNLGDSSLDMPLVASHPSDCRFYKCAWGCYGTADLPSGIIVGGTDNGGLLGYDADKFIQGEEDCLLFKKDKHSGAVKALDFNPFQSNLLASGGAESEIFIWDLNNCETPMTPGATSQPPEDVACISWNRQVQHILASTFASRCVVWDLRKNEPIIKVSDSMSRIKCKLVCWNPEVATQMCLSSEDDHTPFIQLWDLRYATSPVKVLENHQRGILSMAWCPQDADMLLSCGKDNRILCWNPNSAVQGGEVVYELPTSHQWSFDVQWCPRNPNVISSSSFDGHVTCYSLMGGGHPIHQADRVSDSFASSADPFSQMAHTQPQEQNVIPLQKPPKWLKRPVGANFGFGGKLVSYENIKSQGPQHPASCQVTVSQVVTETDLMTGSQQLEQALTNGQHVEFCAMKAANASDSMQESIWNFLMVNFEKEPREKYIQMLGYDKTELAKKVSQHTKSDGLSDSMNAGVDADELAQKMNLLGTGDRGTPQKALASSGQASPNVGSKTPGSQDELNFSDMGSSAFDEIGNNAQNNAQTVPTTDKPLNLAADDNAEGLLCQALLTGNFEAAVDMCLSENRMAEAILLAIAGGPELLSRTQKRYFQKNNSNLTRLVSAVVTHDWGQIVSTCELDNWKEALAVVLTYSPAEEFASLCDTLAARLETEGNGDLASYAGLCYICSGNVEKMVENCLSTSTNNNTPLALQDLVEKVMLLRKAVEHSRGQAPEISSGLLSQKLSNYASILAAQGRLDTALRYLGDSQEHQLSVLRERLYQALGQVPQGVAAPWQQVNVEAPQPQVAHTGAPAAHQQPAQSRSYQATANSNFNTATTASSTSQNPYGNYYQSMNGGPTYPASNPIPAQPVSAYSAPVMATGPAPSKGPLAHKYPSYAQPATTASYGTTDQNYGMNTGGYGGAPAATTPYNPLDYNSSQQPQQNYYSGQYMNPSSQAPVSQSSLYPNTSTGAPYTSQPMSNASSQPRGTSYQDHKPNTAWNDPPMVHTKNKPSSPPADTSPITNPLFGGAVPTQTQLTNDQGAPGAPSGFGNYYNPQEYQPEPQRYSGAPTSTVTNHVTEPKPPAPEPVPVVKPPVPAEHQIVQEIFDNLVHGCRARASNAQMKRKLEDVTKKLEVLYDRLRESALSPQVTQGLHQIVQCVQQGDYNTGLGIYTQLVSQGNFSEISTFMPGLKMLIQSAAHLQVFVQ